MLTSSAEAASGRNNRFHIAEGAQSKRTVWRTVGVISTCGVTWMVLLTKSLQECKRDRD